MGYDRLTATCRPGVVVMAEDQESCNILLKFSHPHQVPCITVCWLQVCIAENGCVVHNRRLLNPAYCTTVSLPELVLAVGLESSQFLVLGGPQHLCWGHFIRSGSGFHVCHDGLSHVISGPTDIVGHTLGLGVCIGHESPDLDVKNLSVVMDGSLSGGV